MSKTIKRSKRYLLFVMAFVFLLSYSITSLCVQYYEIYEDELSLPDFWYTAVDFFMSDDTSCYTEKNDVLVPITDEGFLHNPMFFHNPIFFHETSCYKNIGLRQACSIESAARSHPYRPVHVLFTKPLREKDFHTGPLGEIYNIPNVYFTSIDLETYALNTPLQKIFDHILTAYGKRHYRRVAEFLKFITLYRFGGMVVDLDLMVVASVNFMGYNWAGKENTEKLGSAVISVSQDKFGRKIAELFLSALWDQAKNAEIDGGQAIYEVLSIICNTTDINEMLPSKCQGFQLYSSEFFYPINHISWQEFFKPGDLDDLSFGYHLWNSENHRLAVPRDSLYARIARRYCPSVFKRFMYAFVDY